MKPLTNEENITSTINSSIPSGNNSQSNFSNIIPISHVFESSVELKQSSLIDTSYVHSYNI
jgi:hypothetical protein